MAQRVTFRSWSRAPVYDPLLSSIHVLDMHRDENLHGHRLSDLAFGMLWYGLIESAITQTDVCDFRMAFRSNLRIHPLRQHEGLPFLGPDGLAVTIRGEVYNGGNATILPSPLTGAAILAHPNYQQWISTLIFCGGNRTNSQLHAGIMNGIIRPHSAPALAPAAPAAPLYDPDAVDTSGNMSSDSSESPSKGNASANYADNPAPTVVDPVAASLYGRTPFSHSIVIFLVSTVLAFFGAFKIVSKLAIEGESC